MFLKSFLFLHKLTENRSLSETGYLKVRIPVILWSSKKVLTDFIGEAPTPTLTDYLESTEIENCPYSPSSPPPYCYIFSTEITSPILLPYPQPYPGCLNHDINPSNKWAHSFIRPNVPVHRKGSKRKLQQKTTTYFLYWTHTVSQALDNVLIPVQLMKD